MSAIVTRRAFTKIGAAAALGVLAPLHRADAAEAGWRVLMLRFIVIHSYLRR